GAHPGGAGPGLGDQEAAAGPVHQRPRPAVVRPAGASPGPGLPRHLRRARAAAPAGPARAGDPGGHRGADRDGHGHPAAEHPGEAARRVRAGGHRPPPGLHRGLGAPEAERQRGPDGAVQGPVQERGRAGGCTDRGDGWFRRPPAGAPAGLTAVRILQAGHVVSAPVRTTPIARSRLVGVLALLLALVLGLSACTKDDGETSPVEQVTVGGDFGALPQVTFPTPLEVTETETSTVIEGEGPTLAEGDVALLSYLAVDASTGEVIEDNFGSQPQTMRVTQEDAGPLYESLLEATEGSRLLRVELGTAERPDPVVIVYDVMHTRAWGQPVDPPA